VPFIDQTLRPLRTTRWNAVAAVYGVLNARSQVIYVGQTDNLQRRIVEHLSDYGHCMHPLGATALVADVVPDPIERTRREAALIREYSPPCNVQQPAR
jgi:predicted GIY-YIG superfamily endonuclease